MPQPTKNDIQLSPKNALAEVYQKRLSLRGRYGLGTLAYIVFAFSLYLKVGRIEHGMDGRMLVASAFVPPLIAGAAYIWGNVRQVRRIVKQRIALLDVVTIASRADVATPPEAYGAPSAERTRSYRAKVFADEIVARLK